jgi:hypothetical protein
LVILITIRILVFLAQEERDKALYNQEALEHSLNVVICSSTKHGLYSRVILVHLKQIGYVLLENPLDLFLKAGVTTAIVQELSVERLLEEFLFPDKMLMVLDVPFIAFFLLDQDGSELLCLHWILDFRKQLLKLHQSLGSFIAIHLWNHCFDLAEISCET